MKKLLATCFLKRQRYACRLLFERILKAYFPSDPKRRPPDVDERTFFLQCCRVVHFVANVLEHRQFALEFYHPPTHWPSLFNSFLESVRFDLFPKNYKFDIE
jgi:hypothetical protein